MWNHRLVRLENGNVGIYEVYYTRDTQRPFMRTEEPIGVIGDNREDAMDYYIMLGEAFRQPVLDYTVFQTKEAEEAQHSLLDDIEGEL